MSGNSNIAVLILAAGASTRMGSPKQLLKWGNSTIIAHAIDVAKELESSDLFVVLGANYREIKPEIEHYPIKILKNEDWKIGLGKSIAYGVEQVFKFNSKISGILILLADQPLVNKSYLNSLIDKFEVGKKRIIATLYKNGKQGVPVLFDMFYIKELSQLSDDKGANVILKKYAERVIAVDGKDIISDIDTLEDYAYLYNSIH